jgi:cbb3-type cytochrome oxidase subunit 3
VKTKILEHSLSIILVSVCLLAMLFYVVQERKKNRTAQTAQIQDLIDLEFIDYSDPFQKALLRDVMNIFYPGRADENEARLQSMFDYQQDRFLEDLQTSHLKEGFSAKKFFRILGMYAKFVLVYLIVMVLTFYGVQTIGVWRFLKRKQKAFATAAEQKLSFTRLILIVGKKAGAFFLTMISFAPAYVIAYSIRTEFNTDMLLFVVVLAVISNGLLIMYANRFYNLLLSESRKGYVETAMVKNLDSIYGADTKGGISINDILKPVKRFKGHVFGHIFKNAQFQYLSTLKEQATFLITGLIIIEMALNIHGHLSYEMLRQLLHENYEIVVIIFLFFFYTVKLTEIITDVLVHKTAAKYANK